MILEILECCACGRLVIAVGETERTTTRVHDHKCAGRWNVVNTLPMSMNEAQFMVETVQRIMKNADVTQEIRT